MNKPSWLKVSERRRFIGFKSCSLSHHCRLEEDLQGFPEIAGPVATVHAGAGQLKVVVDGSHVFVGAADW